MYILLQYRLLGEVWTINLFLLSFIWNIYLAFRYYFHILTSFMHRNVLLNS